MFNFSGKRPEHIGVRNGSLALCSSKPNCVCSLSPNERGGIEDPHSIPPFDFHGDPADAMTRLVAVLLARPECSIVTQERDYIHAEFKTRFFGFVDDVEFHLPAGQSAERPVIHVRSASRLGYSDFGVNRARVEELRIAFDDADS